MKKRTPRKPISPFQKKVLSGIADGNNTGKALADFLWPKKKKGKLAQAGRWQAVGAIVKRMPNLVKIKAVKDSPRPIYVLTAKGQKSIAA